MVVDDHPLMREGLKRVIFSSFPHWSVGEASNGSETMSAIWNQTWDLVLLDLSIPGKNGLELLKEIREQRPKLPVLILSMHPEEQFSTRALRAGASGYLSKSAPSDTLLEAIRQLMRGGKFITSKVAEMLANNLTEDSSQPVHERLSDRELNVLLSIGRGQSVGDIARTLNLSVKTVSTYRARVRVKTGLRNNAEMVQYVIRNTAVQISAGPKNGS